ncbi:MAG: helix-turn-helix domain-containing protein [Muribaculaceae bacterium]|nr:helix-turn-helix domain-containing protein [Muribaculaceae bacterium]
MKATKIQIICRILLLSLGLLSESDAVAINDISVRLYDQRKVLAGNYSSFCNDRDGFLWVGTDAGLLRFDGNHADLYRNDERDSHSISDNKIVSLYSDSKGRTWVGTVDGLNLYDENSNSFRLAKLPGMALNGYVRDMAEFPDGRLLFLVSGIGLFTVDMNSIESDEPVIKVDPIKLSFDDGTSLSRMISVDNNEIFFTTVGGSVCRLNPDCSVELLAKIGANVSKICWQPGGSLILSSQYELFRLDLNSRALTTLNIVGKERIKVTEICSSGDVTYISTAGDGLWEVKHNATNIQRANRFTSSNIELSSLKIGSVYVDHLGNLWMGCNNKGLAMAPAHKGTFFIKSLANILREEGGAELTSMCVIDNVIAFGLNNGKVVFFDDDGGVRKIVVSQGAPVTSLSKYSDGRVLVGVAREGIWSVNSKSLALSKIIQPSSPYPGVVVSSCENGNIVAAFGEIGVLRYNPVTHDEKWFYPVGGSNLLSCGYYSGISHTSDGRIWIGGYSGIACYDPEVDNLMPIEQSPFFKGVVNDVCDYPGGVMIATDRGLMYYSRQKGLIKKYTVLEGLPDNDVRTLESDDKGGIWIGTMKGIAYLPDADSKIRSYGGMSGVSKTSYVFSDRRMSPSEILLGNFESLVMFDPDSVMPASFGSNLKITGLYVNGRRLTIESRAGSSLMLEGKVGDPDLIHLSHKDNSLVIRLSTLDFRDPSDLRYEWQLDGEGETWHSSAPGESVIYLPPLESGRHKLRLRGWENDMVSDIREMDLDVKAPWYLSNMAYATYFLMILAMGGLIYKVVKNKREEELYETKIKYFMDISHELRSPVTLMLNPVETLLKQNHSPETTSQLLTMRRNGQRVLNLVDQLLDLRKIEKGKMRLIFTDVDIKAFIEEFVEMFQPMAKEKKQTLSFVCSEKELWGKVDCNNLDKILVNLISNAIKYTPEGGNVVVKLKKISSLLGEQKYSVTVTDTGIGLDSKMISHLFDRFYRNREYHHGNASGFGIGLDLCLRLVQLHKGEITAKNRDDGTKGSVFSVVLPLIPAAPAETMSNDDVKHRNIPAILPSVADPVKPAKSGNRCRIMVVDDDQELRDYIKECLGSTYKVVTMPNAETALKELSEKLPDLIVTDIKMNEVDGISFLRRIKTNMATQHIPVILFSSIAGNDERIKGWKNGADGYLAKPFAIDELEGMISGLLSTRSKLKGKFSGSQESVNAIEAPKVKGIDEDLVDRINAYINDNLSDPAMNVDGLSDAVGLSRSQLHRRMKDLMGVAPSDYIRNVKLRKACELLSRGDVDIAQVAYSLGFNAQSHFSTLFKRYTGMTPTEYRTAGKDKIIHGINDTN